MSSNGDLVPLPEHPWDRQGESAKAYNAFCVFRDLGSSRTLPQVAEKLGTSLPNVSRWSRKHGWVERALAYDIYRDREFRRITQESEEEMLRRHAMLGAQLGLIALKRIQGDSPDEIARKQGMNEIPVMALHPMELGPADVERYVKSAVAIERAAHGLPTDLVKAAISITASDFQRYVSLIVGCALEMLPPELHESFLDRVREIGRGR